MLESSFVCVNSLENVLPFDSGIKITVYQNDSDKRKNEFSDYFVNRIANISAIFDRHNSYKNRVDLNTRFEDLYNLKSFNDDIKNFIISNETEKYIDLSNSEILYKGLKEAYEFSLNSIVEKDGIKMTKYNMTIGALSDLYNKYIDYFNDFNNYNVDGENDSYANKFYVIYNNNPEKNMTDQEVSDALNAVLTYEELNNFFEFNDSSKTIKLKKLEGKEFNNSIYPSISLSGFAKGYVENILKEENPKLPFLIDGGTSSIMTNNVKTNGEPWKIRINNPIYYEELSYWSIYPGIGIVLSDINEYEVYLNKKEDFVLSTSGYYNNYYYSKSLNNEVNLYQHIIDPYTGRSMNYFDSVTIVIDDAGLGDMYSTALMNCSSLEEAEALRKRLDSIYNQNTDAIYMRHDKMNNENVDIASIKSGIKVFASKALEKELLYIDGLKYDIVSNIEFF